MTGPDARSDVRSKQYDADNQIRRHHTDCNIPVVISHYTIIIINGKCDFVSIDFGRYHHHINDVDVLASGFCLNRKSSGLAWQVSTVGQKTAPYHRMPVFLCSFPFVPRWAKWLLCGARLVVTLA